MSYQKAENILPEELLRQVQQYVDGTYLYIPRVSDHKRDWGASTSTKDELTARNRAIYAAYCAGCTTQALAEKYFLSVKSIQRIVRQMKQKPE
jgi:DNA-binding NarL/FixJ family response regulator